MAVPSKRSLGELLKANSAHASSLTAYTEPKRSRTEAALDVSSVAPPSMCADPSDYECSICLSLLVDPVVGQCGHDFCRNCLDSWRAGFSPRCAVSCPICRQPAMAPGVTQLGVCVRLQKMIATQFPAQLEARQAEVAAAKAERACARRREIDTQVQSVQQLMRARFHVISSVLRRPDAAASSAGEQPQAQPSASLSEATVWAMRSGRTAPAGDSAPCPSGAGAHHQSMSAPASPAAPEASHASQLPRGCPSPRDAAAASPPGAALQPLSWHQPEADIPLRAATAEHLVTLLHTLRPDLEVSFRERLPHLVRKLEEGLYCTARSREQYADAATLEARLQNLVRRVTHRRVL